jgi:hypothetical protein
LPGTPEIIKIKRNKTDSDQAAGTLEQLEILRAMRAATSCACAE